MNPPASVDNRDRCIDGNIVTVAVMRNGRHTTSQVLYNPPLNAKRSRNIFDAVDDMRIALMDVITPGNVIVVRTMPEQRITIEFKMVMGINQAGKRDRVFKCKFNV